MEYSLNDLKALSQCTEVGTFFNKMLAVYPRSSGRKGISMSEFGRNAGFRSKSFLSHVVSGEKKFSSRSLARVLSISRLPVSHREYFKVLVYRVAPELVPERIAKDFGGYVEKVMRELQSDAEIERPTIIGRRTFYRLYAALGSTEKGASLEELVERTGMQKEEFESFLREMIDQGYVNVTFGRFFPSAEVLEFRDLRASLLPTIRDFADVLSAVDEQEIESNKNLFYYSSLSMNSKKLSEFNYRWREMLLELLDEFQDDDGDVVQEVFFASRG